MPPYNVMGVAGSLEASVISGEDLGKDGIRGQRDQRRPDQDFGRLGNRRDFAYIYESGNEVISLLLTC